MWVIVKINTNLENALFFGLLKMNPALVHLEAIRDAGFQADQSSNELPHHPKPTGLSDEVLQGSVKTAQTILVCTLPKIFNVLTTEAYFSTIHAQYTSELEMHVLCAFELFI